VKDSVPRADDHLPISHRIPNESDTRREFLPTFVDRACAVGSELGVAGVEDTGRSIRVLRSLHALLEQVELKGIRLPEPIKLLWEIWFPPQTIVHGEVRLQLPIVLCVHSKVVLRNPKRVGQALNETLKSAEQKFMQTVDCEDSAAERTVVAVGLITHRAYT